MFCIDLCPMSSFIHMFPYGTRTRNFLLRIACGTQTHIQTQNTAEDTCLTCLSNVRRHLPAAAHNKQENSVRSHLPLVHDGADTVLLPDCLADARHRPPKQYSERIIWKTYMFIYDYNNIRSIVDPITKIDTAHLARCLHTEISIPQR